MHDIKFMKYALDLAARAKGQTSPNPMVGSVCVKNNRIVGEGFHKRAGFDHAEIIALKKAGLKARGSDLYVTLEPCFHFGKTPPCVDAVIRAGVRRVIIAMTDPNPLTSGKSIRKLRRAGIKVDVGVCKAEAEYLNEIFIKYITKKMPFVVAKCAQTLDGKIATATGDSKWITSDKTRVFSRQIRNEFDAILVGSNTVVKDNPSLAAARKSKSIKKIIVDSTCRISLKANIFKNTKTSDCFVATTKRASKAKIIALSKRGVNVIICPIKDKKVDLKWLFKELAKNQISSILIEGGAKVIGSALKAKLVDKMHIYVAPKIVGDQRALSAIDGLNVVNISKSINLRNLKIQNINRDIWIQGYV